MAKQHEDQGGVATMDPSAPARWLTSALMRRLVKESGLHTRRAKVERVRRKTGAPHRVEYFHQVEDGYSHLAAQLLQPLAEAYDVELVCHLVGGPTGRNAPEPALLLRLSSYDAAKIAPHYGLTFPPDAAQPSTANVELATRILAGVAPEGFAQLAPEVGKALWQGSEGDLEALAQRHPPADAATARAKVAAGTERREALGHYSGAMFHYGKEWYWGVDRLYHLEHRLNDLGANKGAEGLLAPRPAIEAGPLKDDGALTLEFYPSIRSPYTSLIFPATVDFAAAAGVKLALRPVLPMVMRGVPATRAKGFYIFQDAAREARALGLEDWGNFHDPIGEPTRRCYSLYPWAVREGRGVALLDAFMRAAFREGVNTNSERGMRHVVEAAGLPWADAKALLGNSDWEDEIEANRLAMYGFGLWGVPSYRLLDPDGAALLAVWGQDRLWLVAREVQRWLAARKEA